MDERSRDGDDDGERGAPDGFAPIFRTSPLLDALGGFMSRGSGPSLEIGLLVGDRHLNSRGLLHGGVVATLADTGMGYLLAFGGPADTPPRRLVTVSLAIDYVAAAHAGDWLRVTVERADATARMVFATGRVAAADRTIGQVRAIFAAA